MASDVSLCLLFVQAVARMLEIAVLLEKTFLVICRITRGYT